LFFYQDRRLLLSITIPFLKSFIGEISFGINEENMNIRAGQLLARLRLYPIIILTQVILEPLFVILFWDHADHLQLLMWLVGIYAIHAIEILIWSRRYRDPINTIQQCIRWRQYFNIFVTLIALMWGSIALLFFPSDLAYQALMICLLLGLAASAVTLDSVYPPSLYIFVLGVILPLLARLCFEGSGVHLTLAGMLSLFLVGSLSAGHELSKTFWKSLWQRHENDFLIEQLIQQRTIAETANGDKSRFLASASHDLRQPLQALVLFSESLQEVAEETESRRLAGQIGRSVNALVDMFDELLDISKFDAGVVQVFKQNFKVQMVFDRLQTEFMPQATAKGLDLNIQKTDQFGYSDPHLLERILRNLVSNAIRYTDFGTIKVNCQQLGNMLQFDIIDTGIGIRAKSLPHIFEEYYQVDNTHRDRLKGLGLGLAIVRRMEKLLDCQVTVVSKPALGSVFTFSIPLGQGEPETVDQQRPQIPNQSKHNLNGVIVALIDDNRDIRIMAAKLMTQWGCLVYAGESPLEVLNDMSATGTRPDILICDYRLPEELTAIDGIQRLGELWKVPIPTVVLTGDTAIETLQAIQSSGALLLHKPIAPARLRSIMHSALHNEDSQIHG
jgi:two-component system, sensor histidine kinase